MPLQFTLDGPGRTPTTPIDLLAMLRIDTGAEVLLIRYRGGASRAFRVAEIIERSEVFTDGHLALPVVSLEVMSFASFVGLS
jgi:hypothetical protein